MKNKILSILKYILTFAGIIAIFNLLLYLVCLIPSESIKENVIESVDTLLEQDVQYLISPTFGIRINNATDSVIINECYSINYKSPFESYMKARKNYDENLTTEEAIDINGEGISVYYDGEDSIIEGYYSPLEELNNFVMGQLHTSINYARYWHGYLILYRPLLLIFNISEIRQFLFIAFLLFIGLLVYFLNKRFGKKVAFIYAASLICSGYFTASFSLESAPIFLTMIISNIILVKRIDKIKDIGLYIFSIGCIANIVDYLTVPLISLGTLCGIYVLKLQEEGKDWKYCIRFIICNSISWLIAYASTWLMKWIIYDLTIPIINNSMISIGLEQGFYRMNRSNEFFDGTIVNTIINVLGTSSLYIIISLIILFALNKFKMISEKFNYNVLPFVLISFMPIVWYLVLANHTIMHSFFTYRHSLLFMLGMLLASNELFFGLKDNKEYSSNSRKEYRKKRM